MRTYQCEHLILAHMEVQKFLTFNPSAGDGLDSQQTEEEELQPSNNMYN